MLANDINAVGDFRGEATVRCVFTARVLERWRSSGDGPAFVKLTRKTIRYRNADLDAFIAGRMRANTVVA